MCENTERQYKTDLTESLGKQVGRHGIRYEICYKVEGKTCEKQQKQRNFGRESESVNRSRDTRQQVVGCAECVSSDPWHAAVS